MNFLLTTILFLQARTPNNANVAAPVESYDTWGVPLWGVGLILFGIAIFIFWLYKKGMIGYGTGAVPKGTVHKVDPPPPSDGPPSGPINV